MNEYLGASFYKAPLGSKVRLSCNASHWRQDAVSLILWFKNSQSEPMYTVENGVHSHPDQYQNQHQHQNQHQDQMASARHQVSQAYKGRARFISAATPPYLELSNLEENDQAEYRCRIDYRARPRENLLAILFVLVPAKRVDIVDASLGKASLPMAASLGSIYGPLSESSDIQLMCLARGGRPSPALHWRPVLLGMQQALDHSYLTLNDYLAIKQANQKLRHMNRNLTQQQQQQQQQQHRIDNVTTSTSGNILADWNSWPEFKQFQWLDSNGHLSGSSKQNEQLIERSGLLSASIDDSVITSVNILSLSRLDLIFNQIQEQHKQQYNNQSHSNGFMLALECQASNMHHDLSSLIHLFAPQSLYPRPGNLRQNSLLSSIEAALEVTSRVGASIPAVGRTSSKGANSEYDSWTRDSSLLSATSLLARQIDALQQQIHRIHSSSDRLSSWSSALDPSQISSRNITLNIYAKPKQVSIVGSTSSRSLSANQLGEFICETWGSAPNARLQWFKNGILLEPKLSRQVNELQSSDSHNNYSSSSQSKLVFKLSASDHGAQLTCRASNLELMQLEQAHSNSSLDASIEDSLSLVVNYSPKLKLELGSKILSASIREHSDIYFQCHVDAQPGIREIIWLHNSSPINDLSEHVIISNSSLVLQRVSRNQRGSYSCMATNSEGVGQSNEIELRVLHPPICLVKASNKLEGKSLGKQNKAAKRRQHTKQNNRDHDDNNNDDQDQDQDQDLDQHQNQHDDQDYNNQPDVANDFGRTSRDLLLQPIGENGQLSSIVRATEAQVNEREQTWLLCQVLAEPNDQVEFSWWLTRFNDTSDLHKVHNHRHHSAQLLARGNTFENKINKSLEQDNNNNNNNNNKQLDTLEHYSKPASLLTTSKQVIQLKVSYWSLGANIAQSKLLWPFKRNPGPELGQITCLAKNQVSSSQDEDEELWKSACSLDISLINSNERDKQSKSAWPSETNNKKEAENSVLECHIFKQGQTSVQVVCPNALHLNQGLFRFQLQLSNSISAYQESVELDTGTIHEPMFEIVNLSHAEGGYAYKLLVRQKLDNGQHRDSAIINLITPKQSNARISGIDGNQTESFNLEAVRVQPIKASLNEKKMLSDLLSMNGSKDHQMSLSSKQHQQRSSAYNNNNNNNNNNNDELNSDFSDDPHSSPQKSFFDRLNDWLKFGDKSNLQSTSQRSTSLLSTEISAFTSAATGKVGPMASRSKSSSNQIFFGDYEFPSKVESIIVSMFLMLTFISGLLLIWGRVRASRQSNASSSSSSTTPTNNSSSTTTNVLTNIHTSASDSSNSLGSSIKLTSNFNNQSREFSDKQSEFDQSKSLRHTSKSRPTPRSKAIPRSSSSLASLMTNQQQQQQLYGYSSIDDNNGSLSKDKQDFCYCQSIRFANSRDQPIEFAGHYYEQNQNQHQHHHQQDQLTFNSKDINFNYDNNPCEHEHEQEHEHEHLSMAINSEINKPLIANVRIAEAQEPEAFVPSRLVHASSQPLLQATSNEVGFFLSNMISNAIHDQNHAEYLLPGDHQHQHQHRHHPQQHSINSYPYDDNNAHDLNKFEATTEKQTNKTTRANCVRNMNKKKKNNNNNNNKPSSWLNDTQEQHVTWAAMDLVKHDHVNEASVSASPSSVSDQIGSSSIHYIHLMPNTVQQQTKQQNQQIQHDSDISTATNSIHPANAIDQFAEQRILVGQTESYQLFESTQQPSAFIDRLGNIVPLQALASSSSSFSALAIEPNLQGLSSASPFATTSLITNTATNSPQTESINGLNLQANTFSKQ